MFLWAKKAKAKSKARLNDLYVSKITECPTIITYLNLHKKNM